LGIVIRVWGYLTKVWGSGIRDLGLVILGIWGFGSG